MSNPAPQRQLIWLYGPEGQHCCGYKVGDYWYQANGDASWFRPFAWSSIDEPLLDFDRTQKRYKVELDSTIVVHVDAESEERAVDRAYELALNTFDEAGSSDCYVVVEDNVINVEVDG